MDAFEKLKLEISTIEKALNYSFLNKDLLLMAFTHRSFVNENREIVKEHNERLEFLGDSVMGLIVSDFLYHALPLSREGNLSHLRSGLVNASSCVHYMQKLGITGYALMGNGELQNEGRGRDTIIADLFEAIIGAIYLDGGLEAARAFFLKHLEEEIQRVVNAPQKNWKAILQDYSQKKVQRPPDYEVIKEEGPDHLKIFYVIVKIDEKKVGEGEGFSKKQAQQNAAQNAVVNLNL